MNRSILIVIADFLLLSLLAFSSLDAFKLAVEDRPLAPTSLSQTNALLDVNQDLVDVLKSALEDERRARQDLAGELNQTKEVVRGQQTMTLEQERQNQAIQQALQQKELQTRQLEQTRLALQQQISAAQTNLQSVQQQLRATTTSAAIAKEKLTSMEDQLRRERENSSVAQQQADELENARRAVEAERQQLAQRLQVLEAERRVASEQLAAMQDEVESARKEKAKILQHADKLAEGVNSLAQSSDKLAEGVTALSQKSERMAEDVTSLAKTSDKLAGQVTTLAKSSENLTQEIREHRPLTSNAIFNDFLTNRVHALFNAVRSGIFGGDRTRRRETEMILTTDGTNTFAVCHVEDTPFTFWTPGTDWEKLTGSLSRSTAQFPIDQLSFYLLDPRIIMIPIRPEEARRLNCRVYPLATDRFRFQDAVLVGAKEGYYGESKFQIDLSAPQYVKFDRNLFRGLFGKFNPSRGDLVFTKTGELLGIMANSTYCIVLHNFTPAATFQFGENARPQNTGEQLAMFYRQIMQLPPKLQ